MILNNIISIMFGTFNQTVMELANMLLGSLKENEALWNVLITMNHVDITKTFDEYPLEALIEKPSDQQKLAWPVAKQTAISKIVQSSTKTAMEKCLKIVERFLKGCNVLNEAIKRNIMADDQMTPYGFLSLCKEGDKEALLEFGFDYSSIQVLKKLHLTMDEVTELHVGEKQAKLLMELYGLRSNEQKSSQMNSVMKMIKTKVSLNPVITRYDVVDYAYYEIKSNVDQSVYIENKVEAMLRNYNENNYWNHRFGPRSAKSKSYYYAPYSTICQSSGYGKSRAIELMGANPNSKFYVNYCCLREEYGTGFPRRSRCASTILAPKTPDQAAQTLKIYIQLLIEAIIRNKLSSSEFYKRYSPHSQVTEEITELSTLLDYQTLNDELVLRYFNNPEIVIENAKLDKPLLIVFDKASSLIYRKVDTNGMPEANRQSLANLFLAYRRALHQLKCDYIFVLFIDTTWRISKFVPSAQEDKSFRVADAGAILFPPIYLLPTFDAFRNDLDQIDCIESAVKLESICSYGRPLWGSWMKAKRELSRHCCFDGLVNERELIQVAACRIVGFSSVLTCLDESFKDIDNIIAILSVRVGTIQVTQDALREELVSAHMATLMSVSADRTSLQIAYPSEPVLALASAIYYWSSTWHVFLICQQFKSFISNNLVEKGMVGELVIKIALLHAFDKANPPSQTAYYDTDAASVTAKYLTVSQFVESLFGTKAIWYIKKQLSDDKADELLNGLVFFTHFYKPSKREFTYQDLITLMRRGAAGECKKNLKLVNLKIPITLRKGDFTRMSAINVQIKLWNSAQKPSRDHLESINLASCLDWSNQDGSDEQPPPSLTILIHLHSHRTPQLLTLIDEIDQITDQSDTTSANMPNSINLACLYAEGLETLNFDNIVKLELKKLCATECSLCDHDQVDNSTYEYGFDVLEDQRGKEKCEKCNHDDDCFTKCVNCRQYFHLRCSLPTALLSDDEFAMLKDQVARYDWKCVKCKKCYICNRANSLVLSCIKCNRWMHIKCARDQANLKLEYQDKDDTDFRFVPGCGGCMDIKLNK